VSENGDGLAKVGEVVQKILANLEVPETSLLLDMQQQYPHLRMLLLGGAPGTGRAPAASISIQRSAEGVSLRLAIVPLSVEAMYDCNSLFGTLEQIETELAEGQPLWRPDWQRRKRERSAWSGLV